MFILSGTVTLNQVKELPAVNCPGDIVLYNCSVESNTEDLELTWRISLPNKTIFTVTHNSFSTLDTNEVDMIFDSTLTTYSDTFIESILVLTLLDNVSMDGIIVECSIHDLDSEIIELDVDFTGTKYT